MDASEADNVKAEKDRAMRRYNRLRSAGKLFRIIEIVFALLFLFWTFARVPFAVRISGEFFARAAGVIASPIFVFLLCNAIIATLIAKSSPPASSGGDNVKSELYDKIIKNNENRLKSFQCYEGEEDDRWIPVDNEIVYQDKQIICEESATPPQKTEEIERITEAAPDLEMECCKIYRRTKSEMLAGDQISEVKKELRRSETERLSSPSEEMSNEQFQKTIEEFIAKQLRFRREETLSIVPQTQA